jgi:Cu-Zn family superoxide dismutase
MKKIALLAAALAAPMMVVGQQAGGGGKEKGHKEGKDHVLKAVCVVVPMSKTKVHGVIYFTQKGHTVEISGEVGGLAPGKHGFHVHEFGDLTKSDGMSTGGHYDPDHGKTHGKPSAEKRHVGDLGNITADESGKAVIKMKDTVISLHGPHSIVGRAIIVHEKEDDYSQPVGNAGKRYGAGVIGIAK